MHRRLGAGALRLGIDMERGKTFFGVISTLARTDAEAYDRLS